MKDLALSKNIFLIENSYFHTKYSDYSSLFHLLPDPPHLLMLLTQHLS